MLLEKFALRFSATTEAEGRNAENGCQNATVLSKFSSVREIKLGNKRRKSRRGRRSLLQISVWGSLLADRASVELSSIKNQTRSKMMESVTVGYIINSLEIILARINPRCMLG